MVVTLTCEEVGDLCQSKESLKWLETQLICDPKLFQEAIHALCSQLTRGKDFCSANKRIKMRANKMLFAKLGGYLEKTRVTRHSPTPPAIAAAAAAAAGNNLNSSFASGASNVSFGSSHSSWTDGGVVLKSISPPKSSLYGAVPPTSPLFQEAGEEPLLDCTVAEFSQALGAQSARWGNIPADEVLSVAVLIDSATSTGDGVISWEDFYAFSLRLDARMAAIAGDTMTNETFAMLYEDMVREREQLALRDVEATATATADLSQKLSDTSPSGLASRLRTLATAARGKQLNPLSTLVQILSTGVPGARLDTIMSLLRTCGAVVTGDADSPEIRRRAEECGEIDLTMYRRTIESMQATLNISSGSGCGSGSPKSGASSPRSVPNGSGGNVSPITGQPSSSSAATATTTTTAAAAAATTAAATGNSSASAMTTGGVMSAAELEASLAALRGNASSLAAKLASQSESMDATMGIWGALKSLEVELQRVSSPTSGPGPGQGLGLGFAAGAGEERKGSLRGGTGVKRTPVTAGTFAAPRPGVVSRVGAAGGFVGGSLKGEVSRVPTSPFHVDVTAVGLSQGPAGLSASMMSSAAFPSPSPRQGQGQRRNGAAAGGGSLSISTSELDGEGIAFALKSRNSGSRSPRSSRSSSPRLSLSPRLTARIGPGSGSGSGSGSHINAVPVLAQRARERQQSRHGVPSTPLPFGVRVMRPQPTRSSTPLTNQAQAQAQAQGQGQGRGRGNGQGKGKGKGDRGVHSTAARPSSASAPSRRAGSGLGQLLGDNDDDNVVTTAPRATAQHASFTTRCKPPPERTDMSIFKSPAKWQASTNVNVFDPHHLSWVPTGLTNKYRQRFQTTHDLVDGRKMHAVFYHQFD